MQNRDRVEHCVSLPDDAPEQVRRMCGLEADSELRILFFGGPGDVVGTFNRWAEGHQDPRTPVIAYSSMFYTLSRKLRAKGLILTESDIAPDTPADDFEFIYTPRKHGGGRIGYRIDEYNFCRTGRDRVKQLNPHVIIIGGDAPDALVRTLPDDARVILTVHNAFWPMGQQPTDFRERRRLARKRRAFHRVDAAVCTSVECAQQLEVLGVRRETCFVEMPQILSQFAPDTPRAQDREARRLVFLGRVEPEKGVFDLVSAFDRLAEDAPDVTLSIAGVGSASADLERMVAASPFKDRITLHGLLGAKQVHALLAQSDLLICPTQDFEGLALVVIEAAIHNVPSVTSSIVPARDLFPKGSVEFPARDVEALTECLRSVVLDRDRYREMTGALPALTERFLDRSQSWGSMMYKALTV